MKRARGLAAALLLLAGLTGCTARAARPSLTVDLRLESGRGATRIVPGEYVVVFGDGIAGIPLEGETSADADRRRQAFADREAAEAALARAGSEIRYRYDKAVIGFAGRLSPAALLAVRRASGRRARIEPNWETRQDWYGGADGDMDDAAPPMALKTAGPPPPAVPFGLDRIGQRLLDLNSTYHPPSAGTRPVHVYVIDSGILSTHSEFGTRVGLSYNVYAGTPSTTCFKHGTHVAGTIGGQTKGVARSALLHSVRVIDCQNKVSSQAAIAGVDWVLDHVQNNNKHASVANMSLEFGVKIPNLDSAIQNSIKAGIVYVVAAGNLNYDACTVSPASIPQAITVASTDPDNDMKAGNSGGTCIDLFAPGVAIASATSPGNNAYYVDSGTSYAAPHVAGVAALVLSRHSAALSATTASTVWAAILAAANVKGGAQSTPGWCGVGNHGTAPNRLLHWGAGSPPDGKKDSETLGGLQPRSCTAKK